MKKVFIGIGVFVGLLAVVFALTYTQLGFFQFFAPKFKNVERKVFEETKSYVHGKIQDLAKYKAEYDRADDKDREAIRQIIIMRFAEFDESQIRAINLKRFLIQMRGY